MRHPDWENRLQAYLSSVTNEPFEYGKHDCILFGCAAAKAMTGVDHAAEYRGRYSDAEGAAQALRDLGKGTLLRTVDAVFKRKPAPKAQRGDLVWFKGSVGVCVGASAFFVGEERLFEATGLPIRSGLISIPRADFEKAWAV